MHSIWDYALNVPPRSHWEISHFHIGHSNHAILLSACAYFSETQSTTENYVDISVSLLCLFTIIAFNIGSIPTPLNRMFNWSWESIEERKTDLNKTVIGIVQVKHSHKQMSKHAKSIVNSKQFPMNLHWSRKRERAREREYLLFPRNDFP